MRHTHQHEAKALFCASELSFFSILRRIFAGWNYVVGFSEGGRGETRKYHVRVCWWLLWAVDRNNLELLNLSRLFKVLLSRTFFSSFIDPLSSIARRMCRWRPLFVLFTVSAIYVIIKHGKDNSQSQIFTRLNDVPLLLERCSRFSEKKNYSRVAFSLFRASCSNCCVFHQLFASSEESQPVIRLRW